MELNEQTYQTYFLLYIDKELNAAEIKLVDAYLQDYPHLQPEFDALMSLVQKTPDIVYEDKFLLYRQEALEAALDTDFKKQLYKKEHPGLLRILFQKPIIPYSAIAAMLLLMIGIGYQMVKPINEQYLSTTQIVNSKLLKTIKSPTIASTTLANPKKQIQKEAGKVALAQLSQMEQQESSIPISNLTESVTKIETIAENSTTAALADPITTPVTAQQNTTQAESIETQIVYQDINTDTDDRIIYISNFEIDGDKMRGISRRITALFKRNKLDKN